MKSSQNGLSLLEKAKARLPGNARNRFISDEEIELALAWVKDQVNLVQVTSALGIKHGVGAYVMLANALRQAIQRKKAKI